VHGSIIKDGIKCHLLILLDQDSFHPIGQSVIIAKTYGILKINNANF
jgi:hypothetical protein